MPIALLVREPFGGYVAGETITDPADVSRIASGPAAHFVTRVHVEDAAEVEPSPHAEQGA